MQHTDSRINPGGLLRPRNELVTCKPRGSIRNREVLEFDCGDLFLLNLENMQRLDVVT